METQFTPEANEDINMAVMSGKRVFLCNGDGQSINCCPNCFGLGSIWLQFISGGPYETPRTGKNEQAFFIEGKWFSGTGKSYDCPVCSSDDHVRQEIRWRNCGLEPAEYTWRTNYILGKEGKELALRVANSIVSSLPHPSGWVVIYGQHGRGKSGLLKSVVAETILTGSDAMYVRAQDIIDMIGETFGKDAEERTSQAKARLSSPKVLCVDEVDRISKQEWPMATLFGILDVRYNKRHSCATIFAMNADPQRIGVGWEYLESRFRDGKRVPMGGVDLRGVQ